MAICGKCKHNVYQQAFCDTKCIKCKKKITTGHMPGHKVCQNCSGKLNICEQCGNPLFIEWKEEDLKEFDRLSNMSSSRDQMDRIKARLEWRNFAAKFTKEQLDEMKEELVKRGEW